MRQINGNNGEYSLPYKIIPRFMIMNDIHYPNSCSQKIKHEKTAESIPRREYYCFCNENFLDTKKCTQTMLKNKHSLCTLFKDIQKDTDHILM